MMEWVENTTWDCNDPRNDGVVEDLRIQTRVGRALRLIFLFLKS